MLNKIFTPFPLLKTARLTLRQLSLNDDKEIFALRSNKHVNKFLDRKSSETIEDARSFIQKISEKVKKNESIYWAITLNNIDKLAGTICYFNFSDENEKAEIGYELLPGFQGKGIMQEATGKVIDYGLQTIKLKIIEAHTHIENKSSVRLLEKYYFKKQEKSDISSNNEFIVYKLTNSK